MSQPGYVYVLINPSHPDIVKVGRTSASPGVRVTQLSSATGVPTKFILAYAAYFEDCVRAEYFVHNQLASIGDRVSQDREFFRVELPLAIDAVLMAPGRLPDPGQSRGTTSLSGTADNELFMSLEREGDAYFYGSGNVLQDYEAALEAYERAASAGSLTAMLKAGEIHLNGDGRSSNPRRAQELFKAVVKSGEYIGYIKLWRLYSKQGHSDNANKCLTAFYNGLDGDDILCEPERLELLFPSICDYVVSCFMRNSVPRKSSSIERLAPLIRTYLLKVFAATKEPSIWEGVKWFSSMRVQGFEGQENICDLLFEAVLKNDAVAIADLFERGAKLSALRDGMTPLQFAATLGHVESAEMLVTLGADTSGIRELAWEHKHHLVASRIQYLRKVVR